MRSIPSMTAIGMLFLRSSCRSCRLFNLGNFILPPQASKTLRWSAGNEVLCASLSAGHLCIYFFSAKFPKNFLIGMDSILFLKQTSLRNKRISFILCDRGSQEALGQSEFYWCSLNVCIVGKISLECFAAGCLKA